MVIENVAVATVENIAVVAIESVEAVIEENIAAATVEVEIENAEVAMTVRIAVDETSEIVNPVIVVSEALELEADQVKEIPEPNKIATVTEQPKTKQEQVGPVLRQRQEQCLSRILLEVAGSATKLQVLIAPVRQEEVLCPLLL